MKEGRESTAVMPPGEKREDEMKADRLGEVEIVVVTNLR